MESSSRMPSRTAVLTAAARGLHRDESPPWVLDDWLAMPLGGEEAAAMQLTLRERLSAAALRAFVRWVCVRGRLPEDIVERDSTAGVGQYVILGAGLDSFAYRRAEMLDRLRVFEVDHPASQQWKLERLRELSIDPPANVVYVPVDFEQQTLRTQLATAGFDFSVMALWSWMGVTMYLTLDAIRATLQTIAECPPGSRLVLTYNVPPTALTGLGLATETTMRGIVSELGEPMISLFTPAQIEQVLRDAGYRDITHFGPAEARAAYFADREDVHFGGAQRIAIATVDSRRPNPRRRPTRR